MGNLDLVTGYKGTAHITASDQGAFNVGCVGSGEYVFANGRKFEAQAISNNTVRIFDGDLLVQGRHVTLAPNTSIDVTIANGTQSLKRNDLIVCRYQKDVSTGVESANFVVIQGSAVSGTPTDPTYNTDSILDGATTHDMPLYRVKIDGLNIETVEPTFQVLAPISELYRKHNLIINGDFQCNQRGKTSYSVTTTSAYSVDMWRAYQVQVDVLTEGIKLTGKSSTAQGYFTQFVKVKSLADKYTFSMMVDNEICTFTTEISSTPVSKTFDKFMLTTFYSSMNRYIKVNICPIGTSQMVIKYIDLFEGGFACSHEREDPAIALTRCQRFIRKDGFVSPMLGCTKGGADGAQKLRFGIPYGAMWATPVLEECDWAWLAVDTDGERWVHSGDLTKLTILNMTPPPGYVMVETLYYYSWSKYKPYDYSYGVRGIYLITCEPDYE